MTIRVKNEGSTVIFCFPLNDLTKIRLLLFWRYIVFSWINNLQFTILENGIYHEIWIETNLEMVEAFKILNFILQNSENNDICKCGALLRSNPTR